MMTKMTGALHSVYRARPFLQCVALPIDGGSLETEVVTLRLFIKVMCQILRTSWSNHVHVVAIVFQKCQGTPRVFLGLTCTFLESSRCAAREYCPSRPSSCKSAADQASNNNSNRSRQFTITHPRTRPWSVRVVSSKNNDDHFLIWAFH